MKLYGTILISFGIMGLMGLIFHWQHHPAESMDLSQCLFIVGNAALIAVGSKL